MDNTPPTAPGQEHAPDPAPHGVPSEDPRGDRGPRVTREQVSDLGRLRRSVTDRHLSGVAGGLARHLDVDPVIIRVAFVVATFFGGSGLVLYAAGWLLVPEEGTDDQPLGLDERNRTIGLVGAGVLALMCAMGDWTGAFWFPWPAVVVAAVIVWLVHRNRTRSGPTRTWATGGPGAGQAPYGQASYGQASYGPASSGSAHAQGAHQEAVAAANVAERGAYEQAGWPPAGAQPWDPATAAWVRPTNPRRRGPILFLFTLALIALAEGVLGVADVAGVDVIPSAYPALALGVTAAMLGLGAFWGRAGGLILVGVLAAAATGITAASENWDSEIVSYTPTTAEAVQDSYDANPGDLVVDLSGIEDVAPLDGRDLRIDSGAGTVQVVLPEGVDVTVDAQVGAGSLIILDQEREGIGAELRGFLDGGPGAPELDITIDLGLGEVIVVEP